MVSAAVFLALRAIAILLGVAAIYAAVAGIYEDEEGRLQSVLETTWLRVAYTQDRAVSRHTRLLQGMLAWLTRGLDRMFGAQLFSLHFVGVALCLSYGTGILLSAAQIADDPSVEASTALLAFVFGVGLLTLGLLPSFFARLTPLAVVAGVGMAISHAVDVYNGPLYGLIVTWSLFVGWTAVAGTRALYRRLSHRASAALIIIAVVASLLVIAGINLGPVLYFSGGELQRWSEVTRHDAWEAGFIGLATAMNLWVLLLPLAVLALLLAYTIHRAIWPMVLRPLYIAQRGKLLQHRKTLLLIGAYLALVGVKPELASLSWILSIVGIRLPGLAPAP